VLHRARCLFRRTWQNECRNTCSTAAVWRSLLASQGGVPVSVGLPKMVCRESPKASFEMPRSSFPTVGDAPIRRSGPPRHRNAPWPKPWRGSRLRGFLRPRARPKPCSSLRLTVAETAVAAEGPNATHRSELRSTRRRWKMPDVTVVHRSTPRDGPDRCRASGVVPVARDLLGAVAGKLNFKALLRQRVRSVPLPLPTVKHPILPWALFPFKVPYPSPPASGEKSLSEWKTIDLSWAPQAVSKGGPGYPSSGSSGTSGRQAARTCATRFLCGRGRVRSTPVAEATGVDGGPKLIAWAPTTLEPKSRPCDVVPRSLQAGALEKRFLWPRPEEVDAFGVCPKDGVDDSCCRASRERRPTRGWVEVLSFVPAAGVVRPSWGL
jgi:hypothetical protein